MRSTEIALEKIAALTRLDEYLADYTADLAERGHEVVIALGAWCGTAVPADVLAALDALHPELRAAVEWEPEADAVVDPSEDPAAAALEMLLAAGCAPSDLPGEGPRDPRVLVVVDLDNPAEEWWAVAWDSCQPACATWLFGPDTARAMPATEALALLTWAFGLPGFSGGPAGAATALVVRLAE